MVNNIHDKTVKKVLSNMVVARDYFNAYLPDSIKQQVNLNTLKLELRSFVDKRLQEHFCDLLYKVKFGDEDGYIYLLLESQSTPDALMPFRLLRYVVNIMEYDLSKQKQSACKKLPFVYPLVHYHGKQKPYPYSLDILDCFKDTALAKQYWGKPARLIDLTQIPDEILKTHGLVAPLELIQKYIYMRDIYSN